MPNDSEIIFKNRIEAGRKLADALFPYRTKNSIVLALPRGGVPVGYEVVSKMDFPLDTIVARKIGAPFHPEFAVGAIAPGGVAIFDEESVKSLGLEKKDLDLIIEKETKEMNRRMELYKSGQYVKNMKPSCVIIVDDGLVGLPPGRLSNR